METADLEIRSSGGVVPNDWGVINVTCGVDTVIAQQIQLLHSMNREGRHKHPQQCWEMSQRARGQLVLNRSGTHPHVSCLTSIQQ